MRVDVQLKLDTALDLQKQLVELKKGASQTRSSASDLKEEVEKMDLKLEPIHPGQTHPLLAPYFMIEVPDQQTAERVIDQLNKNKKVEAAFFRPDAEAP